MGGGMSALSIMTSLTSMAFSADGFTVLLAGIGTRTVHQNIARIAAHEWTEVLTSDYLWFSWNWQINNGKVFSLGGFGKYTV